jgi:hypothetical protein
MDRCGAVCNDFKHILRGEGFNLDTIAIATTRVPSFGSDMQDPINGYQPLCTLGSVNVQVELPSPTIQLDRELLAVNPGETLSKDFASVWAPLGLALETHFFVIFSHLSVPSRNNGLLFRDVSVSSNIPELHSYTRVPSPLFDTRVTTSWLRGLQDADIDISRPNSPASGISEHYSPSSNSPIPAIASEDNPDLQSGVGHFTDDAGHRRRQGGSDFETY